MCLSLEGLPAHVQWVRRIVRVVAKGEFATVIKEARAATSQIKTSCLHQKLPERIFFWKVLPPIIFFGVFMSCSVSCQGIYRPSHENSLRITGPFWRRGILDIRTKHMSCWDYTFILPDRSHLRRENGSPQGASAPRRPEGICCVLPEAARRNVVAYCEERFLDWIFGEDFSVGFFDGIFSGLFLRENSQKNPQKKSAPQNPHRPSQNPQKKIRTPKSGEKQSAPKNLHTKIRTKKSALKFPHPHVLAKVPTTPMSETNSSKLAPEKAVNSVPHMASYLSCLETGTPVLHRPPHPNQ